MLQILLPDFREAAGFRYLIARNRRVATDFHGTLEQIGQDVAKARHITLLPRATQECAGGGRMDSCTMSSRPFAPKRPEPTAKGNRVKNAWRTFARRLP